MRIPNSNHSNAAPAGQNTSSASVSSTRTASVSAGSVTSNFTAASADGDNVQISSLSGLFKASESSRAEKLASLSAQVSNGTYNVSADQLSRSIVSETFAVAAQR